MRRLDKLPLASSIHVGGRMLEATEVHTDVRAQVGRPIKFPDGLIHHLGPRDVR